MSDNTHAPINAIVEISVDPNFTTAFMEIKAPLYGGRDVTMDMVRSVLQEKNVSYGIDEQAIVEAVKHRAYGENICAARWTPPVDGVNGEIKYHFDKESVIAPVEDETGTVDYRNLGIVKNIYHGTVIATISMPTDGEPGKDITGHVVPQKLGHPASFSVGTGTVLSEDGTQITAAIDGNLRFSGGSFTVDEELIIKNDVDVSVGNLDFIGNIRIKGNVMEGFSITSRKSVFINGSVTGGTVKAGEDVTVKLGSINSTIEAKGNVKTGFCENSNIRAEGNVESAAFMGGEVFAGKSIIASGKGVMVGGKYTALEHIDASTIGSENYTKTMITLGNNALLSEEKDNLTHEIAALEDKFDQLGKILTTLQEMAKTAKLPPERETMKVEAMKSRFSIQGELKRKNNRIAEIDRMLQRTQQLSVSCRKEFHPGVIIRINSHILQVNVVTSHCKATIGDDGICFAPY